MVFNPGAATAPEKLRSSVCAHYVAKLSSTTAEALLPASAAGKLMKCFWRSITSTVRDRANTAVAVAATRSMPGFISRVTLPGFVSFATTAIAQWVGIANVLIR